MYNNPYIVLTYGKTKYHIAHCESCKASVAIHDSALNELSFMPVRPQYFSNNIPCCKEPNYNWTPSKED